LALRMVAKELGTNTISSSDRFCGSPTAMSRWWGSVVGGGSGGGGGGGGRHSLALCPERKQRMQRIGSRQVAARWPLARHLKQRPAVAWSKARRAADG
jgi:hypothetical protein